MPKLTTIGQREVYDNAKQLLIDNGYNVQKAKLTQSQIRSEVAMSASSTKLHLPIIINDSQNGNAFNTEKRLQLQDVFIVSSISVLAAKPASATDGMFDLFTYGNRTVFSTANTATSIQGVYANGSISMIVDNDQVLPYYPLNWHLRTPETQQGINTGYTASAVNLFDARDGSNDGIIQIEPNFILSGSSQIDANINLPAAMTAVETNSRWVVLFYGLLAQNCSKIGS